MSASVQAIWFKRDLRLHDHAALCEAAARGPVLALYIVEPSLWRLPDSSSRHWRFVRECLLSLDHSLRKRGGALTIRVGEAEDVFLALRGEVGPFDVWSHEETGNAATYARDVRLSPLLREIGVTWRELPSHGVVRRLKSRDGWAAKRDARMQAPVLPVPVMRFAPDIRGDALPPADASFCGDALPAGEVQRGGRKEGALTLQSFLNERSLRYLYCISKPAASERHCSRLSPHIAFGTLSVREIEQAVKSTLLAAAADAADPEAKERARQLTAFLSRLAWRCHFVQKLEQQPSIETHCIHSAFEGMRPLVPDADRLAAWQFGMTGYPLIDAAMRRLRQTGWITFRMRAMLVSFASYHLWLDWRVTAPVLAQLFTDYEPGIHYSQFQMQSGVTGMNALRMYNPLKQSKDHDPEGAFIRRYVPELADVPAAFIHAPHLMRLPPKDYSPPLVEHETAVRRARAALSDHRQKEGFLQESRAAFQTLGSRNRPPSARSTAGKRALKVRTEIQQPALPLHLVFKPAASGEGN